MVVSAEGLHFSVFHYDIVIIFILSHMVRLYSIPLMLFLSVSVVSEGTVFDVESVEQQNR